MPTERSFRERELLEFEVEEENSTPINIEDDDNHDITYLFCEEDYDLCSGCESNRIAHIVQPCGHMICTNCVKKNNCRIRGCRISNNITIDLDDFE